MIFILPKYLLYWILKKNKNKTSIGNNPITPTQMNQPPCQYLHLLERGLSRTTLNPRNVNIEFSLDLDLV
jgi:hypothetical protein